VPVAQHVVEKLGDAWASDVSTVVSNGPFKIEEWKKGQSLTLVKNPLYDGPAQAKLEKIVISFVPQGTTPPVLQMFQADEIDWTLVDPAILPQAIANPDLQGQLDVYPNFSTYYMYFNTDVAPFNDLKVRQAFSHAIDRDAIAQGVMQGLDIPGYTHLPPGFPCSQASDPEVRNIQAFNPELAKKLLAEAGFPNGEGFPKQELWIRQGQIAREGEAIQRMLKENLGVEVELKDVERALYMDKLRAKEITLGLVQWFYDYVDPTNFMDWWASGARHTWKNEQFNTLVKDAGSELDTTKRCQLYNQAERILIEDVGAVFVAHPSMGELWRTNLAGIQANPDGKRVHYPIMYSDLYKKN
jgi:peptide/nickel transport system substrate-binding protein/oligopeptide transport system substrate-binding protein